MSAGTRVPLKVEESLNKSYDFVRKEALISLPKRDDEGMPTLARERSSWATQQPRSRR